MANVMRWRYGETNLVTLGVCTRDDIEIGDLLHMESGEARPASTIRSGGDARNDLRRFHDGFIGVAMQRSPVGNTDLIRIATSGVFEFESDKGSYDLGDRVGPVWDAPGKLENQKVIEVLPNAPELSIGRVARSSDGEERKLLVKICSTIMDDGPQAVA